MNIVDYYINTIYDTQNEKDFINHYKSFLHILYSVKFSKKNSMTQWNSMF